jgi:hypothetical protein
MAMGVVRKARKWVSMMVNGREGVECRRRDSEKNEWASVGSRNPWKRDAESASSGFCIDQI